MLPVQLIMLSSTVSLVGQCTVHNMTHPSMMIASGTPWIRLDFSSLSRIQDCLRLITHNTTLITNSVAGTAESSYEREYVISLYLYWCRHMTRVWINSVS